MLTTVEIEVLIDNTGHEMRLTQIVRTHSYLYREWTDGRILV